MKTFVAGDIQRICEIDKTRYTYVMRQVGIKPEIEVEGTGRSHQFSFKNLLQFAFAHSALRFLSARETIKLLSYLDHPIQVTMPNLYDPTPTVGKLYYIEETEGMCDLVVVGADLTKLDRAFLAKYEARKTNEKVAVSMLDKDHEQHFMIDLGLIKKRILKNI